MCNQFCESVTWTFLLQVLYRYHLFVVKQNTKYVITEGGCRKEPLDEFKEGCIEGNNYSIC